jgi:hypothetical protein
MPVLPTKISSHTYFLGTRALPFILAVCLHSDDSREP